MELKNIRFKDIEGAIYPSNIEVSMSIEEALWIAKIAGSQQGSSPHNGIYDCLVGDVFNRYWDTGCEGADANFNIAIPPIKYEIKKAIK